MSATAAMSATAVRAQSAPPSAESPERARRLTLALTRRALRDARVRTIGFVYLFALIAYIQPVGYRTAYPTRASRIAFAHAFAHDKAVVLFYGKAYNLLTIGGYCAWRVGGTLAIFAAVFGILAAVRALRTEEDSGRAELVLAGIASRGVYLTASLSAVGITGLVLGCAEAAGLLAGGLPAGPSLLLALSTVSVIFVFVGIGAVISQLAATHRLALQLGSACVTLALLLRVVADTASGAGWLRWLTPLGWAEEQRPFTGERPLVLLAPIALGIALLLVATRLERHRDIGSGLLAARERSVPRLALLSSATAQALRGERAGLSAWLGGIAAGGFVVGVIAKSTKSAGLSPRLLREMEKLGTGPITTPSGYVGLTFLVFVLVIPLFAVSQVSALRREEAEQELETLLALPLGRYRWLGGRIVLALAGLTAISLTVALITWAGVEASGTSIPLAHMLEAGANCLVMGVLFLGIAILCYGFLPRAATAITYAALVLSFVWQLFGSILSLPHWSLNVTPFAHLGLAPAQPFRATPDLLLVAIGLACALAGAAGFRRRDLTEA